MRDAIDDHHIWLPRAQEHRERIPTLHHFTAPVTSFTTEELKEQAKHQAQLDSRWGRSSVNLLELTAFDEYDGVHSVSLLPGGEHVVVVYRTGLIRLRSLKVDPSSKTFQLNELAVNDVEKDIDPGDVLRTVEPFCSAELGFLLVVTVGRNDGSRLPQCV